MTIARHIRDYQPPDTAVDVVRSAKIALLAGLSGSGIHTIKRGLLEDDGFAEIISYTTRQPREVGGVVERDGREYHFVSEDVMTDMLRDEAFVEAKLVNGVAYGTSIEGVGQAATQGVAIADIDVTGVEEYKAMSDQVVAIFIISPTYDEWMRRLKRRYKTNEDFLHEWPKRREHAIKELTRALEVPYYHFVINDDLERAIAVTAEIAARSDIFTRKDDEARLAARDLLRQITM